MSQFTKRNRIPKVKGHVNTVFNSDLIYLMASIENRLVDTVNNLTDEVEKLRCRVYELERESKGE